jgi:hypothetical protein
MRFVAPLIALALLGSAPDPSASARYFTGTWKCGSTTMTFAPFADNRLWTRVSYGSALPEGTAIMGYVASLNAWVFRDFHNDGAYADLSSPGPSDGRWQWAGPYYPAEGGPPLSGRTTYTQVSPTRFDRTFELLRDDDFVPTGNDTCLKTSS